MYLGIIVVFYLVQVEVLFHLLAPFLDKVPFMSLPTNQSINPSIHPSTSSVVPFVYNSSHQRLNRITIRGLGCWCNVTLGKIPMRSFSYSEIFSGYVLKYGTIVLVMIKMMWGGKRFLAPEKRDRPGHLDQETRCRYCTVQGNSSLHDPTRSIE